tara:strand:+ start:128 stop:352 length:225 start_codon:yes stop_codon:yes gene_type:complete
MASEANLIEAFAILEDPRNQNPDDVESATNTIRTADKADVRKARKKYNSTTATPMPEKKQAGGRVYAPRKIMHY